MEQVSARLYQADKAADRFRSRIAKPRRGCKPEQGAAISDSVITFLFATPLAMTHLSTLCRVRSESWRELLFGLTA